MKLLAAIVLIGMLISGCTANNDLVVVSKELHRDITATTEAGSEFGTTAGTSTNTFYVTGQLQNTGAEERREVELTFRLAGGTEAVVVRAQIPKIGPGETVDFRSEPANNHYALRLKEDAEVEIAVGK